MAKLQRYLQKIFANNSNQVGVFGTGINKVASKNVETLQSADYENGWSAAVVTEKNYPIWQERDGVDYGFSYQLAYLMQSGMPEWLSTETYYQNDFCRVGSTLYRSLKDNNTNNNPANSTGYWTIFTGGDSQITNCLLEVPQRVQYTLAEGVLTILQGSVIMVPYGTTDLRSTITVGSTFINSGLKVVDRYWDSTNSKFYVWAELQADLVRSATAGGSVAQRRAFVSFTSSSLSLANSANTASASSDAGATQNTVIFYNTTENLVKSKSSGTIQSNVVSFPIMITESDATYNVASVKQVFNGMGYIGSVIWADKDLHIVIPNGRNADGTLKNNDRTSTGVATIDVSSYTSSNSYIRYTGSAMSNGVLIYDAIENFNHINGDVTAHRGSINICKYVTDANGVIISAYFFTPLNVSAFYSGSQTLTDMGLRNPNIDINTTPASNMFGPYIRFYDKYDNYLAYLYYRQASTGQKSINLMCENGQGGSTSVQLGYDDNGNQFFSFPKCTTAPTTLTSTASSNLVPVIIENGVDGTAGYRIWSDKYCEQWSVANVSSDSTVQVSLLKNLRDKNGKCFACLRESFPTGTDAGVGIWFVDPEQGSTTVTKVNIRTGAGGGSGTYAITWCVGGYLA